MTHTQEKKALERSLRLHAAGFLTGAAVAVEEDKSLGEVIRYGIAGAFATLFFEVACPKAANFLKKIL